MASALRRRQESIGEPMRTSSRRSGDPTTSPQSASLDDTYLSSPMKRSPRKRGCEEMNPHFFTAPFSFAFIWFRVQGFRGGFAAIIYGAMPDQESFSPLPLEGADERSEAGLASPCVKISLHAANLRPFGAPPSKGRREKSGVR